MPACALCKWYPGVPSPLRHPELVDVVIFRENTEDVYAGIEYKAGSPEAQKVERFLREEMGAEFFANSGIGIKPVSEFGIKRLVRKALQYAVANERKNVTFMHKGNIQKFTEGAFMQWGYELARQEFGGVTHHRAAAVGRARRQASRGQDRGQGPHRGHHVPADAAAAGRVRRDRHTEPERRLPERCRRGGGGRRGHCAGREHRATYVALFEATHGTAPKYANQDKVNPGSLLLSGVMMLDYIGWTEAAERHRGCLHAHRGRQGSSPMTLPARWRAKDARR